MPSLPSTPSILDLEIGPLVIHILERRHPDIDCPFDRDWLSVNTTLNGVPPDVGYPGRSVEAEDLAQFQNELRCLVNGEKSVAFYPFEGPFGVELTRIGGDAFIVKLTNERGETAETTASIFEVCEWIGGLSVILRAYPPRSKLTG